MTVPDLNSAERLIRSDQTVTTQLAADRCVALDLRNGEYYTFNKVASVLWQLLETPQSLDSMVAALVERYAIPEPTAKQDATAFLAELRAAKLLQSP